MIRLDGDTYEATRVSLEFLYPGLSDGGYLIIDDYGAYEECRKAVEEYRVENDITAPIEAVDWTCVRWRKGATATAPERLAAVPTKARNSFPVAVTPRSSALHTAREMELAEETARLRDQLSAAEREIHRMRRAPVTRLTAKIARIARRWAA